MSERFSPFGTGRTLGPIGEDLSFRSFAPLSQEAVRAKIVPRNAISDVAVSETAQIVSELPDTPEDL